MEWLKRPLRRWNSIHNQILFFILLFLIIPLALSVYWIDKPLERVIEQKIGDSTEQALYQVNFNAELFLQDMLKSAVDISTNPNVIDILKRPDALSYYDKLRLTDSVINRLYRSYFTETFVTLLDRHGNWLSNKYIGQSLYNEYLSSDWYQTTSKQPYGLMWMANNNTNYIYYDKRPLITLVKTVADQQSGDNIGTLLFSVEESDIRKYLGKLEGEVDLIGQDGRIITSSVQAAGGQVLGKDYISKISKADKGQVIIDRNGQRWIATYNTVSLTGWKLVQFVPYDKVFKEIFHLRRTNIVTGALVIFVFMLFAISIAYRISKPVKLLNKRMQEIEKKDFNSSLSVSGPKEISTLIDTYNKMAKQIRDLLQHLKEQYKQKEEMRFRALQAQINPHFILNTLNNIKWMAYIRQDKEVGEMLSSLGCIMEASIGRGDSIITLKEEIDYVRHYVTLMKLRYNDKLSVQYEIPESLMSQEVIKFMLQPIMENSILHGIEQLEGQGRIVIEAAAEDERMTVTVTDNGIGMSEDRLEEIRDNLASGHTNSQSIGMKNVHERIRLQYGDQYGLRIDSVQYEMTKVTITLPLQPVQEGSTYAAEGNAR